MSYIGASERARSNDRQNDRLPKCMSELPISWPNVAAWHIAAESSADTSIQVLEIAWQSCDQ